MPGEFGGGIIEINTKAVPSERILDLSFSSGFNSETSLSDGLLYDGGDDDDLGYDDGTRDFPSFVQRAINGNQSLIGQISKLINLQMQVESLLIQNFGLFKKVMSP